VCHQRDLDLSGHDPADGSEAGSYALVPKRSLAHGEFFQTKQILLAAARDFFDRYNQCPDRILSVIGSNAKQVV
jgi:hypothetical protein